MRNEDFHYVGDGRGKRQVFVNGHEIKLCVWADVKRGIACFLPHPCDPKRKRRSIPANFAA
jgi:hypothetical protein